MKIESSVKNSKIAGIILILFSFIFCVVTLLLTIQFGNVKNNWIEYTGVIVEVNEDEEHIVVSYLYEDVEYNVIPLYYSSKFELHDELIIYINPDNLNEIKLAELENLYLSFFIVAGVFDVIGSYLLLYSYKRKIFINECLDKGIKKTLYVTEIKRTYIRNNSQRYYYLKVLYNDKEYKSELFKINKDFDKNNLGIVDMYLLENGKYYIDLHSYRKKEILEF